MDKKSVEVFLEQLAKELDEKQTHKQAVDKAVSFWRERGISDEAILDWLTERLYSVSDVNNPDQAFIEGMKYEIVLQELTEYLRKEGLAQAEIDKWLTHLTSRRKDA